jgi:hypothetical protein
MGKAGANVFIPSQDVITQAMGFENDADKSLCLARTRVSADETLETGEASSTPTTNVCSYWPFVTFWSLE